MAVHRASTRTAPSGSTPTASFKTDPDYCETYGHDLVTGAAHRPPTEYRAMTRTGGRSCTRADYQPSPEVPDDDYPLLLTTGRTVYHFHTRTKTGRAPQLDAAAPEVWVELHPADAARLGIAEGDLVEVASPRGACEAPARISGIRAGRGLRAVPLRLLGRRRRRSPTDAGRGRRTS